jgi:hypothetical protein
MATAALRKEEGFGLVLALAAHAGLVAWLVLRPPMPDPLPLPETMTVTLSDDPGLTSTSPGPLAQPSPDSAPVIGEAPPPPEPMARIEPEPVRKVEPKPLPKAAPRAVVPQRIAPAPRPSARPITAPPRAEPLRAGKPGGTRLGRDFLSGVPDAQATDTGALVPASQIGASVRSSLASAIARELKPRWVAPQGAEAEKLVTVLSWELNADGSLAGSPRIVRQEGITDANRAQAQRHAEQAIRAVRLAAPFDLPPQYYNAWKRVSAFRFDRRLSQ